jgi:hypothetical protein
VVAQRRDGIWTVGGRQTPRPGYIEALTSLYELKRPLPLGADRDIYQVIGDGMRMPSWCSDGLRDHLQACGTGERQ